MPIAKSAPLWGGNTEGRVFTRLDVTTMLSGALLADPAARRDGRPPGPHFRHRHEHARGRVPADDRDPAIHSEPRHGEPQRTSGRRVGRKPDGDRRFRPADPEQHGRTDLHEVYPGNARGNTTQMIAAAITENVLNHVDALIDFHSGGSGGRLQARVDYNAKAPEDLKAQNLALARAFGAPFVHENEFAGAASHYLNSRGIPAVNPEVGGSYLGPESTRYYTAMMINGLSGMMRHLGMLGGRVAPVRQIQFGVKARREIRPRNSGYLVSHYERPEDLGKLVAAGTKLGEVVDLYTYEMLEELVAPFDGYLFFSRYSGVVGGGTQAFALAEAAGSKWLEESGGTP